MKLIEFPEVNIVYAKDQVEYNPLPAYKLIGSIDGAITCCWKLSLIERFKILFTGKIWHRILTFNRPLQPQLLMFNKPELNI